MRACALFPEINLHSIIHLPREDPAADCRQNRFFPLPPCAGPCAKRFVLPDCHFSAGGLRAACARGISAGLVRWWSHCAEMGNARGGAEAAAGRVYAVMRRYALSSCGWLMAVHSSPLSRLRPYLQPPTLKARLRHYIQFQSSRATTTGWMRGSVGSACTTLVAPDASQVQSTHCSHEAPLSREVPRKRALKRDHAALRHVQDTLSEFNSHGSLHNFDCLTATGYLCTVPLCFLRLL